MSEYWKSQPKKFCEFCKVWITDNKPSIEFHERGKKHQENAKRKIIEVQKKGRDAQKANEQMKKDLEAIEAAALKAYQKDLAASKPSSEISGKSSKQEGKEQPSAVSSCVIIYHGTEPVAHCTHGWSVGKSPDGHYYYYNTSTNGSQWQLPECMDKTAGKESPSSSIAATEKQQTEVKKPKTKEKECKETLTKGSTNQNETESSESTSECKPAKPVPSGPYGQWTTVVTYPTASESTSEERPIELNTAEDEATEALEEKKAAKPLFKERVAPKLNIGKGNSGEVAFKKRKLNSEKKRNIRRTEFTT